MVVKIQTYLLITSLAKVLNDYRIYLFLLLIKNLSSDAT